jgi:hypothetical protein
MPRLLGDVIQVGHARLKNATGMATITQELPGGSRRQ